MIFSFLPFMIQYYFPELSVSQLGTEAGNYSITNGF